jgi:ABC-type uncharacterized transport system auxiliary subunit
MKTLAPVAIGLALLFGCGIGGCGISVGPKELPLTTYYHLDMPDPLPAGRRIELDLAVLPFSESAALERDGIRYRSSDVEGGYWQHHRWAAPVADMARGAVQMDLDRSGQFRRVLLVDQSGYAEALLTGEVLRWEEEDREDGWYAVVEIHFDLVLRAARDSMVGVEDRVILSRRFARAERAADRTVPEVVRALSRALSGLIADLRIELATVTAKEGP